MGLKTAPDCVAHGHMGVSSHDQLTIAWQIITWDWTADATLGFETRFRLTGGGGDERIEVTSNTLHWETDAGPSRSLLQVHCPKLYACALLQKAFCSQPFKLATKGCGRYPPTVDGETGPGMLILTWSNEHSRVRSKDLQYWVKIDGRAVDAPPPVEEPAEEAAEAAEAKEPAEGEAAAVVRLICSLLLQHSLRMAMDLNS